jgi:hypothetical protein
MSNLMRTGLCVAGLVAAAWAGAALQSVAAPPAPLTGLYSGMVTSSADPLQQGRVLVTVDGVPGQRWAAPSLPYPATAAQAARPLYGQYVWVMFERGDPNHPVWIGWPGR